MASPVGEDSADRQYVRSPTPAINGSIVVGHPYSVLAWVPEPGRSWAPPVSVRRITSQQTAVEVGVAQVKLLCRHRQAMMAKESPLIVGDCKYGNHKFLGPLKDEPCGVLVRLRRDRVLYGEPGPYSGFGRPRVHGDRFAFKEPETWGEADAEVEVEHRASSRTGSPRVWGRALVEASSLGVEKGLYVDRRERKCLRLSLDGCIWLASEIRDVGPELVPVQLQ